MTPKSQSRLSAFMDEEALRPVASNIESLSLKPVYVHQRPTYAGQA